MVKTDAFAKTKAGVLQGVCIDGVYRFLGVHYAENTEGENRFMPPVPVKPWDGVRPALEHVAKCWQTDTPRMEDEELTGTKYFKSQQKLMTGSSEMGVGRMTEDCLALNIWSKGLRDGKKRPVMVWFHGGAHIAGAAEADWHDGYALANNKDVVVVCVGHRLGMFGYLYLGEISDKYKNSANVGHQDMAESLKWVHENIEAFGGDPDNITIFGQSGGGGKVASLMAMPASRGLVHKAILQSGGILASEPARGTMFARQLLDFLNIDDEHVDDLQKIPAADLIQASRDINKTRTLGTYFDCPVIYDGQVLRCDPFDGAEGTEVSRHIPVICGYTKDDNRLVAITEAEIFTYTMEELPEKLAALEKIAVEETGAYIDLYKGIFGEDCNACDIYTGLITDHRQLERTVARFDARNKFQDSAPMYSYVFNFEGPDPDLKAIHGVDVPFFFGNAQYAPGLWTCDTYQGAMKLNRAASAAWAAFARTGNPSNPYMPVWKPYDTENRYSMMVDVESELVSDYHKDSRKFLCKTDK